MSQQTAQENVNGSQEGPSEPLQAPNLGFIKEKVKIP